MRNPSPLKWRKNEKRGTAGVGAVIFSPEVLMLTFTKITIGFYHRTYYRHNYGGCGNLSVFQHSFFDESASSFQGRTIAVGMARTCLW